MLKPLLLITLLLPFAAHADIQILNSGEEASCKLVKQETCKTTGKKPEESCLKWHKEQAEDDGADAILIGGSETSSVRRPSLTGAKTVITTKISASYYNCDSTEKTTPQQPTPQQPTASQPAASALTIEQRLIRLNTLKDKGLITQDEYDQKRQKILNEL